jgi:hypothetical protein
VARQLHLAEVPLPERPPHLVLPHPHSSLRRRRTYDDDGRPDGPRPGAGAPSY